LLNSVWEGAEFQTAGLGRRRTDSREQIKRDEAGTAQPILDALIRLVEVLHVRLDDFVLDEHERGSDEGLAIQFGAVIQFSEH
jgi:hypothetical protein